MGMGYGFGSVPTAAEQEAARNRRRAIALMKISERQVIQKPKRGRPKGSKNKPKAK